MYAFMQTTLIMVEHDLIATLQVCPTRCSFLTFCFEQPPKMVFALLHLQATPLQRRDQNKRKETFLQNSCPSSADAQSNLPNSRHPFTPFLGEATTRPHVRAVSGKID